MSTLDKSNTDKSISLLIGAGFSAPQGYPTGNQLSKKLLNCDTDKFAFNNDGTLVVNDDGSKPNIISAYNKYFEFFVDLMNYYNNQIKTFDYEKFYDYCKNKAKEDTKVKELFNTNNYSYFAEFDDYMHNIDLIFNQIILKYLKDKNNKNWYTDDIYIRKPVFDKYTGFLDCIETLLKDNVINVHTLNHDLFFERLDNTEWINGELCDGFEEHDTQYSGSSSYAKDNIPLPYYSGNYNKRIRLYKLHGSIDYYVFYEKKDNISFISDAYIKNKHGISAQNLFRKKMDNGNTTYENCWINYHSDFLTGFSSKTDRYNEPLLYKRLFQMFETNLKNADMLIIIGYGFKDDMINKKLSEFFNKNRPCYIIDLYESNEIKDFISKMGDKTRFINKSIEFLTMNDIVIH